ncbi:reticulon-2-like, partial [Mantella aurantiaca]
WDLLYWKDVALSAGCLTGVTLALLSLMQFSVISVVSYTSLILLCASLTIRSSSALLHGMKRGAGGNPFQKYLDVDPLLPVDQVDVVAMRLVAMVICSVSTLRRLFLVENTKESLKFLVLLYLLTYVGAVLNGLTLLLLGVIGLFSFPVIYKHNQGLVDGYLSVVSSRVAAFRAKFRAQLKKQGPKKD